MKPVKKRLGWIRLSDQGPCETCGADVQHWIRLTGNGHRAAEVTFCPVCSPEVQRAVQGIQAGTRLTSKRGSGSLKKAS